MQRNYNNSDQKPVSGSRRRATGTTCARMALPSGCQSHGYHQRFIALLILCFLDCGQGDGKGNFRFC